MTEEDGAEALELLDGVGCEEGQCRGLRGKERSGGKRGEDGLGGGTGRVDEVKRVGEIA